MRECMKECYKKRSPCSEHECRMYIDYDEDLNCTLIAVKKHGPMTLEQIGTRHHISIVRAKQILDKTLGKLKKTFKRENTI